MAKDETILCLPVKLVWETEPADQGGSDDRGNTETLSAVRYISAVRNAETGEEIKLSRNQINQLQEENS